MVLTTLLTTLLTTFATPDLCAEVYRDPSGKPYTDSLGQTLPRYCAWTGPDVPVWDADVCCSFDGDVASCTLTDAAGQCARELERAYCKYGELVGEGFVCYRPFADACEAGWCIDSPPPPEAELAFEYVACCSEGGACQYVTVENIQSCQGELVACEWGILHDGGVVECLA